MSEHSGPDISGYYRLECIILRFSDLFLIILPHPPFKFVMNLEGIRNLKKKKKEKVPYFIFSCQKYPAAVLSVVGKGNALVNNNNKKPKAVSPATVRSLGTRSGGQKEELEGRNQGGRHGNGLGAALSRAPKP